MKNLILKSTLLMVLLSFLTIETKAQCTLDASGNLVDVAGNPCVNTIATAVPFLRIVADARSGAMGDVGLAISADANAIQFNAAKLVFAEKQASVSATYTPWLRSLGLTDVYLAYLSGYYQLDDLQAIGASLRFFSLGSIQFTDINGDNIDTGNPNEFEFTATYSRKLSDYFSASLSGKYIYSNLAAGQRTQGGDPIEAANAGAADIGLFFSKPVSNAQLSIGLALTNIGSKVSYTNSIHKDFLPANIGLGAAYEMELDDYNSLTLALDINKLMVPTPQPQQGGNTDYRDYGSIKGMFSSFSDAPGGASEELKELAYSVGAEYWYDQQFAIRAGYFYEHAEKGNRQYVTAGLGLKYNVFGINVSYLVPTSKQRSPLDNTLRFSLLFDVE